MLMTLQSDDGTDKNCWWQFFDDRFDPFVTNENPCIVRNVPLLLMVYIWRLSAAPWSKHILEWPKWFFLTGPRLLIWISMWADRRFHLHWPLTAGMWYNLYVSGMTSSSIRGMINQYLNLEYRNWTDSLNRIWSTWFYWSNLIRISFFSLGDGHTKSFKLSRLS